VVRNAENIDFNRDLRTTSANLADHYWSAEQTLGISALETLRACFINCIMLRI